MKPLSRFYIENILSYGMIGGLLIIIVRAMIYLFDLSPTNISFGVLNFVYNIIVLSTCLYLGTITWRNKTATGNLTYGKGFLVCISISFIAVLLIHLYDMIFYILIAPDYIANLLAPQFAVISGNPSIPPMQKIELLEKLEKYTSPYYVTGLNALTALGISVVIALITAIFIVRNRPITTENP